LTVTIEGAVQPSLKTERLVLRPFQLSDAPVVQRLAGERAIADTTAVIPHPYPDGVAETWIATHEKSYTDGTAVHYALTSAKDGELIGAIGLHIAPEHDRAELGYWIAVPHWGRGYATEAARAVVAFCFETLKLHRVQASHLTRNPASGRVLEKAGMKLEGIRRGAFKKWDVFEDIAGYAVLRPEWRRP